jgi:hypothetical protein
MGRGRAGNISDSEAGASQRFDLARVVTLAAPLLGLGAFALLKWVGWGSERDRGAAGGSRELAVWQLLITAQVVVWAVVAGAGLRTMNELEVHTKVWLAGATSARRVRWRKETARFLLFSYAVVVVLLVAGGVAGLRNPYVMNGQDWKIPVLHVVAGAAAYPFFVVLKRVQLCAAEEAGWSTTARDIERLHLLRGWLRSATASLGVIIALAVIATGALDKAVTASGLTPLPDTFVLVYGAWFTGIMAAIYLYVFTALDGRARSLMEQAAPLPDPNLAAAEAFAGSTKLRGVLSAELELGGDPRKNLEGLIAVLSPLVGALLTQLGGL